MIRGVLLIALLVVAASVVGLGIARGSGYVLIAYEGFRYESSLWVFLALLLVLWLVLYLLRVLLRVLGVSSALANPWSRRHRSRRGRKASELGFLELAEGRWSPALKHLRLAAEQDPQPLMYYLGAARAAHQLGDYEGSDNLLERALARQPRAELAVALTHAELQQARGNVQGAHETLSIMLERHPHHPEVLRRLLDLQRQRGDSAAVVGLLPELRKQKVLAESELRDIERQAWSAALLDAGQRGREQGGALQPLHDTWQQVGHAHRNDPELVFVYAEQLRQLGAEAQAEETLRAALKKRYDPRLVELYGQLRGADTGRQLQGAEAWLSEHAEDPVLLRALARMSLHHQLWGKARDYYEASLGFARDPQTCAELARLLTRLGETERSNQLFQEGLGLLNSRPPLPAPR